MAISQRTATSGVAASSAAFTITFPTGATDGDLIVVAVSNALVTSPNAPTGWTKYGPFSAGTNQSLSLYTVPYNSSVPPTATFTNVSNPGAWACNAYYSAAGGMAILPIVQTTPVAASNSTNNTTMGTGQVTPPAYPFGCYEVLAYGWTSSGTISGVASGSTIDTTRANSTSISVALGHNNTASLTPSTATTAFSQTLSANNTRKTGVALLLYTPVPTPATSLGGAPLADNFDDGVLDTVSKWTQWSSGTAGTLTESGGTLNLSAPVSPATGYIGIFSTNPQGYNDTHARIEVVQLPSSTAGSQAYFRLEKDGSNAVVFGFSDGNMTAQAQVAGATNTRRTITWPAGTRFLRLSYAYTQYGVIFYDYSSDGTNWTQFWWEDVVAWATSNVTTLVGTGTYIALASPGTAKFDNLNIAPINYRNLTGTSAGKGTTTATPTRRRYLYGTSIGVTAGVYVKKVLADTPVGYWRLGEPSGTAAADSSGNAHPGTYAASGVTLGQASTLGDGSTAVALAGTTGPSGLISVPASSAWRQAGGGWSMEAWVNVPNTSPTQEVLRIGGGDGWFMRVSGGEVGSLWAFSGNFITPQGGSLPGPNVWVHIAATYDGTNVRHYINGLLRYTVFDGRALAPSNTGTLCIGAQDTTNGGEFFTGKLDDVAVYGYALSDAQVRAHYAAAPGAYTVLTKKRSLTGASAAGRATTSGAIDLIPYVPGAANWTVVDHFAEGSPDKQGFTSSTRDTTGAKLLILACSNLDAAFGVSDNKGNTWVLASENTNSYTKRIYYAASPTVGPGHIFSMTGVDSSPSMSLLAMADGAAAPLDQSNNGGGYSPTAQPGPVTPTVGSELVVTSTLADGESGTYAIDGGFTITDQIPATFGAHWGIGVAILKQTAPAVADPTWTATGFNFVGSVIASFMPGVPVVPGALTGSSDGHGVATAQVSRRRSLTASSAGAAAVSVTLTRRRSLAAGVSGGSATASATPSRRRALAASSAGSSTVSVTLQRKRSLAVTSTGTSTAAGVIDKLTPTRDLVATATGSSTASATPSRRRSLAALSAGATTTTVAITRRRALLGTATATSTAAASVSDRRALLASSQGNASAAAEINARRLLGGTSAGKATVLGLVGTKGSFFALTRGTSSTTAILTARRSLTVASAGSGTADAAIQRKRSLLASSTGVATVTGLASRRRAITASAAGTSSATALIQRKRSLTVTSNGTSSTTALIRAYRYLTATAGGVATASAQVYRLTAGIPANPSAGKATVAGQITRTVLTLHASSAGKATVSVLIGRRRSLIGSSAGTTLIIGFIIGRRRTLTPGSVVVGVAVTTVVLSRARQMTVLSTGHAATSGTVGKRIALGLVYWDWAGLQFWSSASSEVTPRVGMQEVTWAPDVDQFEPGVIVTR